SLSYRSVANSRCFMPYMLDSSIATLPRRIGIFFSFCAHSFCGRSISKYCMSSLFLRMAVTIRFFVWNITPSTTACPPTKGLSIGNSSFLSIVFTGIVQLSEAFINSFHGTRILPVFNGLQCPFYLVIGKLQRTALPFQIFIEFKAFDSFFIIACSFVYTGTYVVYIFTDDRQVVFFLCFLDSFTEAGQFLF